MIINKKNNGRIHEYIYEDIIEEANEFYKSFDILLWSWTIATPLSPTAPLLFPAIVCCSFSCELYMKGILQKYKNKFTPTHNLKTLFYELDTKIQNEIIKNLNACNFEEKLNASSNLFERSRYFFDTEKFGKTSFDIEFIKNFSTSLKLYANNEIIIKEI